MRAAEQDSGIGFADDEAQAAVEAAEGIIDEASGNDIDGVFGQAWSDDRVAHLLERLASDFVLDNTYREQHLSLTASENYPS
ncbi:hypothetical protein ABZZ16_07995, partial [Streptomyces sp. NPDC006386]